MKRMGNVMAEVIAGVSTVYQGCISLVSVLYVVSVLSAVLIRLLLYICWSIRVV